MSMRFLLLPRHPTRISFRSSCRERSRHRPPFNMHPHILTTCRPRWSSSTVILQLAIRNSQLDTGKATAIQHTSASQPQCPVLSNVLSSELVSTHLTSAAHRSVTLKPRFALPTLFSLLQVSRFKHSITPSSPPTLTFSPFTRSWNDRLPPPNPLLGISPGSKG